MSPASLPASARCQTGLRPRNLPCRVPRWLASWPALGLLTAAWLLAEPVHAQEFMYKCRAPNGGLLVSDRPCESQGARQTNRMVDGQAPATPVAPPGVDELAARAREMMARPKALAAAQAAQQEAEREASARRHQPARPARPASAAPAQRSVPDSNPDMKEIDPDGQLHKPLVTYRSPVLDAVSF